MERRRAGARLATIGLVAALGLSGCAPAGEAPTASPTRLVVPSAEAATASSTPASSTTGVRTRPLPAAIVGAPASKVDIQLRINQNRWSTDAIVAPAGETWRVTITNQNLSGLSKIAHNFVVADGPDFEDRIFTADQIPGGSIATITVPALPPGSYFFICTIHPNTMTGTLTLE